MVEMFSLANRRQTATSPTAVFRPTATDSALASVRHGLPAPRLAVALNLNFSIVPAGSRTKVSLPPNSGQHRMPLRLTLFWDFSARSTAAFSAAVTRAAVWLGSTATIGAPGTPSPRQGGGPRTARTAASSAAFARTGLLPSAVTPAPAAVMADATKTSPRCSRPAPAQPSDSSISSMERCAASGFSAPTALGP